MLPRPSESSDRISYIDYARKILEGETLTDKLFDCQLSWEGSCSYSLPSRPGRAGRIQFSDLQLKFPKQQSLKETEKKATALHSFANHELIAIEMMASALLIYPSQSEDDLRFKRGIVGALREEQKHLTLYLRRLNELGFSFGDFPLNDFFWRQMEKLKTPAQYAAVMSLTFEAANLDFAQYYARLFRSFGDEKTANILDTVLEDELGHVSFGARWMKRWKGDRSLWTYYQESLPWPLTPARGKGIGFDHVLHARAMGDEAFADELATFEDPFRITRRT